MAAQSGQDDVLNVGDELDILYDGILDLISMLPIDIQIRWNGRTELDRLVAEWPQASYLMLCLNGSFLYYHPGIVTPLDLSLDEAKTVSRNETRRALDLAMGSLANEASLGGSWVPSRLHHAFNSMADKTKAGE